jgi:inhibitor of growth protein 3
MPRDDLSIDFVVRMPQLESTDPAQILDDFFYRFQNMPEELRFIQSEVAEKDRQLNECLRIIEDRDGKIQKWVKTSGSHTPNPKEESLRVQIRENYVKAERLADEKLALSRQLQQLYDRHILFLDRQIKTLYDRAEPGFLDPDDLPSLLRPSAANQTAPLSATNAAPGASTASLPATPITTLQNATVPLLKAIPPTMRNAQLQQHAASAPATPAASMILNHKVRESSAGPGATIPKRGPRASTGLANTPTTSSGLARHSSLGPAGTAKAIVATAAGNVRAGSAGPRTATTKASSTAGGSRKGTPGAPGRKKAATTGPKSSLSRVKKATSKNSPASTAESDLSEAESGSGAEGSQSDAAAATKRGSQRAASGTPVPQAQKNKEAKEEKDKDGDEELGDADDDEAGDDKKYCLCQNVSFGDMVACDNEDCPYEWFHWTCVGLKGAPNGAWFCPKCRTDKKVK